MCFINTCTPLSLVKAFLTSHCRGQVKLKEPGFVTPKEQVLDVYEDRLVLL